MVEDLHHLPKAEGRRVADRLLDQFDLVEVPPRRPCRGEGDQQWDAHAVVEAALDVHRFSCGNTARAARVPATMVRGRPRATNTWPG